MGVQGDGIGGINGMNQRIAPGGGLAGLAENDAGAAAFRGGGGRRTMTRAGPARRPAAALGLVTHDAGATAHGHDHPFGQLVRPLLPLVETLLRAKQQNDGREVAATTIAVTIANAA